MNIQRYDGIKTELIYAFMWKREYGVDSVKKWPESPREKPAGRLGHDQNIKPKIKNCLSGGELSVFDIAGRIGATLDTVRHHTTELRKVGQLKVRRVSTGKGSINLWSLAG